MENNNVIVNSTINNTEDRERGIACIRLVMGEVISTASWIVHMTRPISVSKFMQDDYSFIMLGFSVGAIRGYVKHAEDYGVMWGVDEDTTRGIITQAVGQAMKDLNRSANNLVGILKETAEKRKGINKTVEEVKQIDKIYTIIEAIDNLYDEMNSKYSFSV